ncbi:MAG: MFS transporter [Emcibacter sp.]|nr:MFS transporter [Emcibacter sp.]
MEKQSQEAIIDNNVLSRYQIMVIALCGLISLLDGFDTQSIAFVAPVIAQEWGVPLSTFGPIFSIGLFGGLLGAIIFGVVTDKFGRRIALLSTVSLFAVGALLTIFSKNQFDMMMYRLVTSFGLGGAMPGIIALTSEYAPKRMRATLVAAMFCGFPLGAVIGAIGSAPLIEIYGWQVVFLVGGMAPLLLLPVLFFVLPESMDWLAKRGEHEKIHSILSRIGKADVWDKVCEKTNEDVRQGNFLLIFKEGRAFKSMMLAITFFVSLMAVFLLVSWIPAIAVQSGYDVKVSIMAAAVLNLMGIIGSLSISALSDRFIPHKIVAYAYTVGAVSIFLLLLLLDIESAIFPFAVLAGFFCIGAQVSLVPIASIFYPVDIRGTGIGFMMAVGRCGAIVGPLVGGLLIDGENAGFYLFSIIGIIALIASFSIWLFGNNFGRTAILKRT